MAYDRSPSGTCGALLRAGVLVLVLVAFPTSSGPSFPAACGAPAPAPPKREEKPQAQNRRDLKELQQVFGNNPVTILYSPHNYAAAWSVEGARITDVIEVFGKQYLRVQKKDGKPMLIRAELITAIRDD